MSCGSGDVTFLICHMTSWDNVIKGQMTFSVAQLLALTRHFAKFDDCTLFYKQHLYKQLQAEIWQKNQATC